MATTSRRSPSCWIWRSIICREACPLRTVSAHRRPPAESAARTSRAARARAVARPSTPLTALTCCPVPDAARRPSASRPYCLRMHRASRALRVLLTCAVLWVTQAVPASALARADVACAAAAECWKATAASPAGVWTCAGSRRSEHAADRVQRRAAQGGGRVKLAAHPAAVCARCTLRAPRVDAARERCRLQLAAAPRRGRIYLQHCVLQR
jgi:hypothetical protein